MLIPGDENKASRLPCVRSTDYSAQRQLIRLAKGVEAGYMTASDIERQKYALTKKICSWRVFGSSGNGIVLIET